MKTKKLTALFLAVVIIMTMNSCLVYANEEQVQEIKSPIVVADLSSYSAIAKIGAVASSVYTKSGNYTLRWAKESFNKNIKIPVKNQDLSAYNVLEFSMYSAGSNGSFTLALISDSPQTPELDYYYITIGVSAKGWKTIAMSIDQERGDLTEVNSPVGYSQITEIRLLSEYGGEKAPDTAEWYFDSFYAMTKKSEASVAPSASDGGKTLMLADWSVEANVLRAGMPVNTEYTLNGEVSLDWDNGLSKAPMITGYPKDWTPYKCVTFEIYSKKITNTTIKMVVLSENKETTDGVDYYMIDLISDFEGWKTLVFDFQAFTTMRRPLGWDQITGIEFWVGYAGSPINPETAFCIDSIYLSSEVPEEYRISDDRDYIVNAQMKENYVDVVSMIKEKNPNNGHPRLIIDQEYAAQLPELVKTDAFLKKSLANVIKDSEAALSMSAPTYNVINGGRFDGWYWQTMPTLAMAFLATKEDKYKDKLWEIVEAVCRFQDWNPTHFLDVGDTSRPIALVYDWLYNDWTPQQRRIIRNGLMKHAIGQHISGLRNRAGTAVNTNNWNQVINSGVGLAALAIADEPGYEDICNETINLTCECLPIGMAAFAPDGACPEGVGYWGYAMDTFLQYDAAMYTSMDFDFGLINYPGMANSGYFCISLMGPTRTTFGFADGGSETRVFGANFYLARTFDKPEFGGYNIEMLPDGGNWNFMAFYRPDPRYQNFGKLMPRDKYFAGEQPVASLRSSWEDENGVFVAFKGGYNSASHGDLDQGDFVMDALGVKWFVELGAEDYGLPGMWESGPDAGRWKYYRKSPEGQNVLLINPCNKVGQNVYARAEITKLKTEDAAAYGIVDLKETYQDYAKDVKRGIGLINNRTAVVVQDEIKTFEPSEIYAFYHTQADIEISQDGKTAYLTQNGRKLKADILSPDEGTFIKMDAVSLPTSASPGAIESPNTWVKKLAVHMTNSVNPTISVLFTPIIDENYIPEVPEMIPLSRWDNYLKNGVSVTSISVDGIALDNFSPSNTIYSINTGILGNVTAEGPENIDIEIQQATKIGESAVVVATDRETGIQSIYGVMFDEKTPKIFSQGVKGYEIKSAEASVVPQADNTPENTFDGDFSTRWAAENECWIKWDLGEEKLMESIYFSFFNGSQRQQKMDISISSDGENWNQVFTGTSSGTTDGLEPYSFPRTTARYIKMDCHGNSINGWNSPTEIKVPEIKPDFVDIADHWAKDTIELFYKGNLLNGVSETMFAPDASVTRAEFVAMVTRAAGITAAEYKKIANDVNEDDWFFNNVSLANDYNAIPPEMLVDGNFLPNQHITREEMTAIIVRMYENYTDRVANQAEVTKFSDANEISACYVPYVGKSLSLRIVKGLNYDLFGPKNTTTRAEAAVIVKRLLAYIAE